MHIADQKTLDNLADKYGAALVAHHVMAEQFGPHAEGAALQDAWMRLVDTTIFHDTIHSKPCTLCGEPSVLGCGDSQAADWYLCPGCEGSEEATAAGYVH